MGIYLAFPILALAAALQATLIPQISIGGVGPDLVLLLVVAWSVNTELPQGISWALIGGIMLDLLSALPAGTSSIPLVLMVFVISGIGARFYQLGWLWLLALTLGGTLFQQAVMLLLMLLLGYRVNWITDIVAIAVPTLAYNLGLVLPVYWWVRRVQRGLPGNR
ncbi:MAG: rod shape-determining protein MreD [Armatimonadetes bacterium]|nr:rod shape-determining protein MreD [Anaerolineae bacterium]